MAPRVTRFGDFSPIVRLFTLASVLKMTKWQFCSLFSRYQLCTCINFDQKLVGLHFGQLFRKLIWSPCSGSVSEGLQKSQKWNSILRGCDVTAWAAARNISVLIYLFRDYGGFQTRSSRFVPPFLVNDPEGLLSPPFPIIHFSFTTLLTMGRCYYHNFLRFSTIFYDFRQFSAKTLAFFSKNYVMIKILHNLALLWVKNANFLLKFSAKKI
jgi:hypothetical protein